MEFILANLAFIIIPFVYMSLVFIGPIIEKHQMSFIMLAIALNIVSYVFQSQFIDWTVFSGQFSLALFMLVIFAGLMPKDSMYRQVIEPVRGDLSIYGFIYLVPHLALNLSRVLNGDQLTGLIAYVLMVPLIITSFRSVRRQVDPHMWLHMHKISYVVYALLYLHVGFYMSLSPFDISVKPMSTPFHIVAIMYIVIKVFYMGYHMSKRKVH